MKRSICCSEGKRYSFTLIRVSQVHSRPAVRGSRSGESPQFVARTVALGFYQKGQFSWDKVGGILLRPGWTIFN